MNVETTLQGTRRFPGRENVMILGQWWIRERRFVWMPQMIITMMRIRSNLDAAQEEYDDELAR